MDMKLDKGMMMLVMPDGQMKTMPMDGQMMMKDNMDMMTKMSMPMAAPMMVMMGNDGKMHTVGCQARSDRLYFVANRKLENCQARQELQYVR